MPSVGEVSEFLNELLERRGWASREQRFVRLSFTRPVREDFVAALELTVREVSDDRPADSLGEFARGFAKEIAVGVAKGAARVVTRGHWPPRPPVLVLGYVGLECLPATRVLCALSGDREQRVRTGAWSLKQSGSATRETFARVKLESAVEWQSKLETLVRGLDERAAALAKAYATLARFIDQLREHAERNVEELLAVLIAYDHTGDAREILEQYGDTAPPARRRCFRQALRVLNAEVSLGDLERAVAEPPPANVQIEWGALRHARRDARQAQSRREEILRAVRAADATTRNERRSVLRAELAARHMHWSPAAMENELDTLEPGPEKLKIGTIGGVREVVKMAREAGRTAAPEAGAAQPPWLMRPEAACYKLRGKGAEACVDLDSGIEPFLDELFSAAVFRLESDKLNASAVQTELWFAHSSEDPSLIVAAIGERRVGLVEPNAETALTQAIAPADARSELAWTQAWLHRRTSDPRYVLEFRVPGWTPAGETG
jgi:hypothetical protein